MARSFRSNLLLLALPAFAPSLYAQEFERDRQAPCEVRMCVRAPCPQPPCPQREMVERTGREVRITLEGRVLRYEVTERWTNHGRAIGEADYVLPLPRGAAFEDLALEIDGELVAGEALDANKARGVYEEIVRRKKDPALVEWMGMGLFRTRIFPIQPGETRTVVVRFRAVAEREGDALRVDVPAPRGNGTAGSGTGISFRWPNGEGFGDVWSPTHRVELGREREFGRENNRRVATVNDATGTVTLLVPVRNEGRAAIGVLTHAPSRNDGYALITLSPPAVVRAATARDITFVIDVSGSMAGVKMTQAKAAGRQFLSSLGSNDRFRLIAFSNDVEDFRDGWSAVTRESRASAERWIEGLRANGGTNIGGALERALEADETRGRLALVLFLTDGAPTVGERRPERLAARASELRGERRVFTFGIGADLNAQLLEQVALEGAGTAHFVRPEEDVERVVGVVAERLTRPVATNLRLRADGVRLHALQPTGRLDLFAGQELTILARYETMYRAFGGEDRAGRSQEGGEIAHITITGDTPNGRVTWEAEARFPERRTADAFVGRLWATQRVGWLSAERRKNGPSREIDSEMRELGERWGIPTELTSYLVVEPGMVVAQGRRDAQPSSPADSASLMRRTRPEDRQLRLNEVTVTGVAGGVASAGAPSAAPTRAQDFEAAKAAAEMRDARSVVTADEVMAKSGMRRAGGRAFSMQNGVWVDSRPAGKDARTVRVLPFSPAYFALIERIGELKEVFALGERVEVHGRAVTLVLAGDGGTQLDAGTLAELARDW